MTALYSNQQNKKLCASGRLQSLIVMTESINPDDAIKPSQELLSEIEVFAEQYLNSKQVADRIIELAKKEGIPNKQLRQLLEDTLRRRGLKKSQIYAALPNELKQTYVSNFPVTGKVEEITTKQEIKPHWTDEDIEKLRQNTKPENWKDEFSEIQEDAKIELKQKKQELALRENLSDKESQLSIALERITELEQALQKSIAQTGFQKASKLSPIETLASVKRENEQENTTVLTEVIFDLDYLKKFWPVQRYSMKIVYCKLEGDKIIDFESDTERNSKSGRT